MNDMQMPSGYPWEKARVFRAIGLMSGTSLDGIDAALLETDGRAHVKPGASFYLPYHQELKDRIRRVFGATGKTDEILKVEADITRLHADAVKALLAQENIKPHDIDVIGFHGQTITHKPDQGFTWQLGDGKLLAQLTGIDVVHNFRVADVKAGGEGAPLIPVYHQALARAAGINLPAVFLNIGGVANVTWIGRDEDHIVAFDTGPGNALMDDYMKKAFGEPFDADGAKARAGRVDETMLKRWMAHEYLSRAVPKSLDRGYVPEKGAVYTNQDMNSWDVSDIWSLSPSDAMATLSALTARTIAAAQAHFPQSVDAWYLCGGGRHNQFLIDGIAAGVAAPVKNINDIGYNGDTIEAEGFAYLAVRHLLHLPNSFPLTTGVKEPVVGGEFHAADATDF